ncbi:MAG TPA: SpoIIE family protein phosphatase [Bacteroidales bacterium]|nr:SpoIIE family protein phosphatase [Bacteroidales bacterium]
MGKRNGLLLSVFLLFFSTVVSSQVNRTGAAVVTWFDAMETPGDLQNWCITMDKRGVMYFGNQAKGIVTYDGLGWGLIRMNGEQRVNALASDYRGIVYAGGEKDFGFIQPDDSGRPLYRSLADRLTDPQVRQEIKMISSIGTDSSTIFFTDRKRLFLYDLNKDSLTFIDMSKEANMANAGTILVTEGRVIIADDREGLFEYNEGKLIQIPGGSKLRMRRVVALLPYDRESIMIATATNGVYLFNMKTGELKNDLIPVAVNNILRKNTISGAVIIPENRFAIGMTGGEGIYIFSRDGTLLQQVSAGTTGIQESTVTAMYCDHASNSQLWFCTTGYINKAYVSLPVSEFSVGTGIKTTIAEITGYNGSAFISDNSGLFRYSVNDSGRVQFTRLEDFDLQVFDLDKATIENEHVLIAATVKGLCQIDSEGSVNSFPDRVQLTAVKVDKNDQSALLAGASGGIILTFRYSEGEWKITGRSDRNMIRGSIRTIEQSSGNDWWVLSSGPASLCRLLCTPSDTTCIVYDRTKGLDCDTLNHIVTIDNKLYVSTGRGIFCYNPGTDRFEKDTDLAGDTFSNVIIDKIFRTPEGDICISGFDSHHFFALVTPTKQGHVIFRKQFDFLPDISTASIDYINNNIWLARGRSIFIIDKSKLGYSYGSFSTFFTDIRAGGDKVLMNGMFYTSTPEGIRIPSAIQPEGPLPVLKHSASNISFNWTTTFYVGEEKTEYRYMLEGFDRDWSKWEKRNYKDFTNLPSGDYKFRLIAKTLTGLDSEEISYRFSVKKPFYSTIPALLFYLLLATMFIYSILKFFTRRLTRENSHLEILVKEKSEAVSRQKEELEASVRYASRIQRALLPSEKLLADITSNYFIFFKPRDIVSGDFYWMARRGDRLFVAVADCTGHGVPGAFMSLLGISFLEEIVNRMPSARAGMILGELRSQIVSSLKQQGETDEQKDFMELALMVIDYKYKTAEFSGAYIPCFKVRVMQDDEIMKWASGEMEMEDGALSNGKYLLETIDANMMPVGISAKMDKEFTQTVWKLDKDISYYLFTDGYTDQFNGNTGKKFMKRNFKKLILDIQGYPMIKQKEILEERLMSWKGPSDQVDDILIVGLKAE